MAYIISKPRPIRVPVMLRPSVHRMWRFRFNTLLLQTAAPMARSLPMDPLVSAPAMTCCLQLPPIPIIRLTCGTWMQARYKPVELLLRFKIFNPTMTFMRHSGRFSIHWISPRPVAVRLPRRAKGSSCVITESACQSKLLPQAVISL